MPVALQTLSGAGRMSGVGDPASESTPGDLVVGVPSGGSVRAGVAGVVGVVGQVSVVDTELGMGVGLRVGNWRDRALCCSECALLGYELSELCDLVSSDIVLSVSCMWN